MIEMLFKFHSTLNKVVTKANEASYAHFEISIMK